MGGVVGGLVGEVFLGEAFEFGDGGGGVGEEGGFVELAAALGFGGEVGCVGFEEEAVQGGSLDDFAEVVGFLVGDDAGEAEEIATVEDAFGFGEGAGEAVEDGGDVGEVVEDGETVVDGLAAVDDDGFLCLAGEVELG